MVVPFIPYLGVGVGVEMAISKNHLMLAHLSLCWSLFPPPFGHSKINIISCGPFQGTCTGKGANHCHSGVVSTLNNCISRSEILMINFGSVPLQKRSAGSPSTRTSCLFGSEAVVEERGRRKNAARILLFDCCFLRDLYGRITNTLQYVPFVRYSTYPCD